VGTRKNAWLEDAETERLQRDIGAAAKAEMGRLAPSIAAQAEQRVAQRMPELTELALLSAKARMPSLIDAAAPAVAQQVPTLTVGAFMPAIDPEIDKFNRTMWYGIGAVAVLLVGSRWWLYSRLRGRR
jgi:hypothetical protein